MSPLRGTRTPRINDDQLRPVANAFQQVMKEDRMCLTRVRAPQQNDVSLLDLPVGTRAASRSEYRRQTGDARRVSSPVTTVNVVRADDGAHELLRNVIQLVRGLRAAEHSERARPMGLNLFPQPFYDMVQRLAPTCRSVPSVLANQRSRQTFGGSGFHVSPPFAGKAIHRGSGC